MRERGAGSRATCSVCPSFLPLGLFQTKLQLNKARPSLLPVSSVRPLPPPPPIPIFPESGNRISCGPRRPQLQLGSTAALRTKGQHGRASRGQFEVTWRWRRRKWQGPAWSGLFSAEARGSGLPCGVAGRKARGGTPVRRVTVPPCGWPAVSSQTLCTGAGAACGGLGGDLPPALQRLH